jgi:hypothetical protein
MTDYSVMFSGIKKFGTNTTSARRKQKLHSQQTQLLTEAILEHHH